MHLYLEGSKKKKRRRKADFAIKLLAKAEPMSSIVQLVDVTMPSTFQDVLTRISSDCYMFVKFVIKAAPHKRYYKQ